MAALISGVALLAATTASFAADAAKEHRVAIQVDQDDPAIMNLVLNNASNILEYYSEKGETIEVDVVAYGPGLHMFRADTSPVRDRIRQITDAAFPSSIQFSACNITKQGMERREGKSISLISQATLVPSGAVHLIERQEQGWSYLRP
ncbi:hypothetical protein HAP47_0032915 [Bradyrhizobium sp. 41S5]|uniref:DsrE family protein n=1 Tax=Bradyrhizobium sp. 41S5 TaxID=1404443 RepID=UPI001E42B118|nr:hypothetical protein [Bradyrhizobium sp. 41S5]UFX43965.1 hypothetical protein HAP47_0032915 [Bradyrhizobium sp. 41S5]